MTQPSVRTQVVPDVGAMTHSPALEPLLFELHREGRSGRHIRDAETDAVPPSFARRTPLGLPELSELQVVRG